MKLWSPNTSNESASQVLHQTVPAVASCTYPRMIPYRQSSNPAGHSLLDMNYDSPDSLSTLACPPGLHCRIDSSVRALAKSMSSKLKPVRGAQTVITDEFGDSLFQRGLQDLHMMVAQHARERTPAEWAVLLAAGGFRMARMALTRSALSVVVAVPAA